MPNTLNPACPFCGLRFENKPILDLHMREDHRQRTSRERNSDGDPSTTRSPTTAADIPADAPGPAADSAAPASRTSTTAAGPAGRPGPATRAKAALRRMLRGREEEQVQEPLRHEPGAFRRANAEFMLMVELMRRPAAVPRPRSPVDPHDGRDGNQAAAGDKADRAA